MASARHNISICFRTATSNAYFLLQVLNLGTTTDELKFVFGDAQGDVGGIYTHKADRYSKGDLVRRVAEVSYHSDGSLLFKMPSYSKRTTTEHRNPQQIGYRRTPLAEIERWEGFLVYRIHNYELCKKVNISAPHFLTVDPSWFDGNRFECRLFLGSKPYPTPLASEEILVQRFSQISDQIDLLVLLSKINERGFPMRIGDTSEVVWTTANVVEIIPHMPPSQLGRP